MRQKTPQQGYTLLFAVIVATVVLGVAVFILGIGRKQYILSAAARDSMYAIYAADSGIDCVAMANAAQDALSTSTPNQTINCGVSSAPITWQGSPNTTYHDDSNGSPYPATEVSFNIGFKSGGNVTGCATVSIYEYYKSNKLVEAVQSLGHNLCDTNYNADLTSPRTVERGLELVYTD
jgi:hypothetical protein